MTDNLPAIQKEKTLVKVNTNTDDVVLFKDFTFAMVFGVLLGAFVGIFFLSKNKGDNKGESALLLESTIDTPDALQHLDVEIDTPVTVKTDVKEDVKLDDKSDDVDKKVKTSEASPIEEQAHVLPEVSTKENRVIDVSKHNK